MTIEGDRTYYSEHPEYHMYKRPENPSYADEIRARDNMLQKHPHLRVVGAHLGSLEWNVDELAKRLDKFPNFAVDLAARTIHLEYQSVVNREKVRDFMIKYQDRIVYGTDEGIDSKSDKADLNTSLHQNRLRDWAFFATDSVMHTDEFKGNFKGLQLPKAVVDKIYRENARHWFSGL
jgi:predicted TIM-barrel fold metal-dependent hydrolase